MFQLGQRNIVALKIDASEAINLQVNEGWRDPGEVGRVASVTIDGRE
jgi:hypothetical protein